MRPYKRRTFSKQIVIDKLTREINVLQAVFGFNPNLGWFQVEGRDINEIVEYGRFVHACDLRESIEEGTL